jgi:hypothetical protein
MLLVNKSLSVKFVHNTTWSFIKLEPLCGKSGFYSVWHAFINIYTHVSKGAHFATFFLLFLTIKKHLSSISRYCRGQKLNVIIFKVLFQLRIPFKHYLLLAFKVMLGRAREK